MRRLLAVLVGVVLGLVLVVVVADEPARRYAQDRVAGDLQTSLALTSRPKVALSGRPFLWHAALGQYPAVTIRADGLQVPARGGSVRLADVSMDLEAVRTASDSATAGRVTGGALLDWAQLSEAAGLAATDAGGGRLALAGRVELLGQAVEGTLTGFPAVAEGGRAVTVRDAEVRLAGMAVPPAWVDLALERFARPVPVELPYGLRLTAVAATREGVAVRVGGEDVTIPLVP